MSTFAKRVSQLASEGAYAVLARSQTLEAQGHEVLHLEIGQPDFDTPEHVSAAGIKAIQEGQTRYNPPAGLTQLRQIIAREAGRQHGLEFTQSQVVVGPGAKPGLFFPTLALVESGQSAVTKGIRDWTDISTSPESTSRSRPESAPRRKA